LSKKDVYLDDLWESCNRLEDDAIRILAYTAQRLLHGQRKYGAITLATDNRSFAKEALEEAADQSVYAAIGMLRIVDSEEADKVEKESRQCDLWSALESQKRNMNFGTESEAQKLATTMNSLMSKRSSET
jgi:hypothetical protein